MNGRARACLGIASVLVAMVYAPAGRILFPARLAGLPAFSASDLGRGDEGLFLVHQPYWEQIASSASQMPGKGEAIAAGAGRAALVQGFNGRPQNFQKQETVSCKVVGSCLSRKPFATSLPSAPLLQRGEAGVFISLGRGSEAARRNLTFPHRDLSSQAAAELDLNLTRPVTVALSSFPADAQSDLVAVASEDITGFGPEPQASIPKVPDLNVDHNAGRVDPVASAPSAQQRSHAAQVLIASAMGTDTPLPSMITPADSPQLPTRFTGKLISLDLRSVDIRDFFRLIHRISGLNIVVDWDVTGSVTLVLDDVPWDQALDLVLKNNGLGSVLEGNVLRIATIKTLESEADETQELQESKIRSEPLLTVVHRLRYASAEDIQPTQSGSSGGMSGMSGMGGSMGGQQKPIPGIVTILKGTTGVLSRRGSVTSDPRDNAVVITDVPSQIPEIEAFIDKLDTRSKQLSIEVRVVLASSDFSRSLSSILSGGLSNKSGSTSTSGGTGNGILGIPGAVGFPSAGSTSVPLNPVTGLYPPQTATGFGAFAITNAGARYLINAALSAAEERDQARTISRPTIVTQDNFPGLVMQGVQIPIQTDINLTVAVQYVNAALEMMVTPRVAGNGRVFLDINVNNASPGTISVANVGISINVQQATTKVLVPDGGTVVFGGITVTTRSRSANYIPLLGSVPILGNLFKSSQITDQNSQLLFFVSPTVLPD
jgi:type IV pilus secretin PilQ/predicted competence protein